MKSESKTKLLIVLIILTSLFGYLEWGKGNSSFLFEAEAEVISKLVSDPTSVIHPFTLLPLLGQILLLIMLFRKRPAKVLTFVGICGIGILLAFMFVIGLVSLNFKIMLSVTPFLILSALTLRQFKRMRDISEKNESKHDIRA